MFYTGYECPVCRNKFKESDDVVVCPICGTPHHRECYNSLGHCANEDKHAGGFVWQAPQLDNGNKNERETEVLICPRCGLPNPVGETNCARCKMPLANQNANPAPGQNNPYGGQYNQNDPRFNQNGYPPFGAGGQKTYSYNNPYADSAKALFGDAKVEDVPVSELGEYIQANSDKYIASFLEIQNGGKKHKWNWSSAIFSIYWLFYRKMVKIGCIATVLLIALQFIFSQGVDLAFQKFAPEQWQAYEQAAVELADIYTKIQQGDTDNISDADVRQKGLAVTASNVFIASVGSSILLYIVFGIVMGIKGNDFYKQKALRDIKNLRTVAVDDNTYHFVLRHNGGTSALNILFPFIIESFISVFLRF